ncbi:MAG: shikimate kinase [Acidobacteria bacterium]|nr:shikimate kinase [Acidobacteriota bacterium]
MKEGRNIVLCGFMATGKSSVGKRLSELAGYRFLDLDAAIEEEEGVSIPEIFASRGEPAFRALERSMVERVAGKTGLVIATGGGTIVNPENLDRLRHSGVIVTLAADVGVILERAGGGDDRPMLRSDDRERRVRALLEERAPAYAQADITLDTSRLGIEQAARRLLELLRELGVPLPGPPENQD